MQFDLPADKVRVKSQLSALRQAQLWTMIHDYRAIPDGDQLSWEIQKNLEQIPDAQNPKQLLWKVQLRIHTAVTVQDLIRTATLDVVNDERLISLIGKEIIPLALKPLELTAPSKEELESLLRGQLVRLKDDFGKTSLHSVKRKLISRWIDSRCSFSVSK